MTAEIQLFGAIAVRPAILAVTPRFEGATGWRVAARWEVNPTVRRQIEAGDAFDLVVINSDMVADLAATGRVAAGAKGLSAG